MFHELKDKKFEVRAVPTNANSYTKEINSYFNEHIIMGRGGYIFDYDQAGFCLMYDPIYISLQDFISLFFFLAMLINTVALLKDTLLDVMMELAIALYMLTKGALRNW